MHGRRHASGRRRRNASTSDGVTQRAREQQRGQKRERQHDDPTCDELDGSLSLHGLVPPDGWCLTSSCHSRYGEGWIRTPWKTRAYIPVYSESRCDNSNQTAAEGQFGASSLRRVIFRPNETQAWIRSAVYTC